MDFNPTSAATAAIFVLTYIVVAIGRDYDDVAPTSGVFVGDSPGAIDSWQSVRVTELIRAELHAEAF